MLLLAGVAILPAADAQPAQTNAAAPVLRVGVSPIFPPMVFKQGDELAGIEVDLARALGQHLHRPVEFVELAWADQIDALNNQKTDIIMSSMSITTPRRFLVDFSKPYFTVGQMALIRSEHQTKYAFGFPAQPEGRIAVLKATTGEFLAQRDFPKTKRLVCKTGENAAEALIKKKADLFLSDSPLVWYLAGKHANDGLSVVPIMLSEEPLAWAVRKGDEKLLSAVNTFVEQSANDGTLRKVFKRWTAIGD
jgi:polar amino acid transport system substrate-binding protein